MLVPIVIFIGCFAIGAHATARWLPEVGDGQIAGLAFLAVCGLLATALSLAGVNVYEIVMSLNSSLKGEASADIVAAGLRLLLLDSGTIFGLAAIVYLLVPRSKVHTDDRKSTAQEVT